MHELYKKRTEEEEKAKKEYAEKKKAAYEAKESFDVLMKENMKSNKDMANDDFW